MKNILNKISKQTLFFISLIGIVVVSLTMLTTFAYQSLQTEYTSDSKKGLTVNAGVLDVTFAVTNRINETNLRLLDNYKTASYSEFTIDNTKSSEDAAYIIELTDLEYSDALKSEDFKYTLVTINNGRENIFHEGGFNTLNSDELSLSDYKTIAKGTKEQVRLYLWIKNSTADQSNLKNVSFKGKIQIKSVFDSETKNLKQIIISNAKNNQNGTIYSETPLTKPAEEINGETESTLSVTNDEYGESYYFRGNVVDNYLDFAGMCWRIVRIMGDGSIKLILEDQDNTCATNNGNWDIPIATGSNINKGNYGYDLYPAGTYFGSDGTTSNTEKVEIMNYLNPKSYKERSMATAFENFQKDKLNNYISLLKSGDWCIDDRVYARNGSSGSYTFTSINEAEYRDSVVSQTQLAYDAYTRLLPGNTAGFNPTLECKVAKTKRFYDETDMYVGTLTADEVVFAGSKYDTTNYKYYLVNDYFKNNSIHFWTLTPFTFSKMNKYSTAIQVNGDTGGWTGSGVINMLNFRPSIILKYDVRYVSGDGTKANAYKVN